jgi:hypothetical protein
MPTLMYKSFCFQAVSGKVQQHTATHNVTSPG